MHILSIAEQTTNTLPTQTTWSVRMADSIMQKRPLLSNRWAYAWGVVLKGIEQVWRETYDERYLDYIKTHIDEFVDAEGRINTYSMDEYNLDNINSGKLLFLLYEHSGDER